MNSYIIYIGDEVLSILRFNLEPEALYYIYSEEEKEYKCLTIEEALKISKEYKSKNGKELIRYSKNENKANNQIHEQ